VKRPAALLIALVVAAPLAAGCNSNSGVAAPGQANLANGQKLFISTCGGCHTLSEAGTKGTIGPNLDEAYVEPRMQGFKSSSFESLVREQIANGSTFVHPPMPPNLLNGEDAQDVAAYVAAVAGVQLAKQLKASPTATPTP
jgi:mono/diheme cytochrome c family protein